MRSVKLAICLTLAASVPVAAQQVPCGDRAQMISELASRYHEGLVGHGLDRTGSLVEFYANTETGTWTALMTRPDNARVSCIVSAGKHWIAAVPVPPGDPA